MIETNGLSNNGKVKLLGVDIQGSVVRCHTASMQLDYAYAAFGHGFDRVRRNGSAHASLAFNGQRKEPDGLYLLGNGHRAYNPQLMVFHSPDRLSPFDRGGINAYAYCGLDPVNWQDRTGRTRGKVSRPPGLATIYEEGAAPVAQVLKVVTAAPIEALPSYLSTLYQKAEGLVQKKGELQVAVNNDLNHAAEMSKTRVSHTAPGGKNSYCDTVAMMYSLENVSREIYAVRIRITRWMKTQSPQSLELIEHRAKDMQKTSVSSIQGVWSFASLVRQSVSTAIGLNATGENSFR